MSHSRILTRFCRQAGTFVVAILALASAVDAFRHPGALSSSADIAFLKGRIAASDAMWVQAFARLKAHPSASPTYRESPFAEVLCGSYNRPNQGCDEINDDGVAVYSQALMWSLTGDVRHAQNAIRILDAWSTTFRKADSSNARLVVGWAAPYYVNGAELLRLPNSGWTQAQRDRFAGLLRKFLPYVRTDEGPVNNWMQSRIEAHMAIAIFLDDQTSFDQAVARWKFWLPVYIYQKSDGLNPVVPPGETVAWVKARWKSETFVDGLAMETCRDLGHLGLGFGSMMYSAEMAWQQGVDLFGPHRKRLTDFMELHGRWMTGQVAVPQNICGGVVKVGESDAAGISPPNGGGRKVWEIAYNHLAQRLGGSLPTTRAMILSGRPVGTGHWVAKWETLTHGERPHGTVPVVTERSSRSGRGLVHRSGDALVVEAEAYPARVTLRRVDGSLLWAGRVGSAGRLEVGSLPEGILMASLTTPDGATRSMLVGAR